MISRRARSELRSTSAGLLLGAIPILHALNRIPIVAVEGAFWHAGPRWEFLGATPSPPSLVGLGLNYKNVPDIPVNITSIFPLRFVSVKASTLSSFVAVAPGVSCLSLLSTVDLSDFFFCHLVSGFHLTILS